MVHYFPKGTWATWVCVSVCVWPPAQLPVHPPTANRHLAHQTLPQDLRQPLPQLPQAPLLQSCKRLLCHSFRVISFSLCCWHTRRWGRGEVKRRMGRGRGLGERRRCRVIQCHLRRVPFGHSSTSLATQGSDLKWQTTLESSLPEKPREAKMLFQHTVEGEGRDAYMPLHNHWIPKHFWNI